MYELFELVEARLGGFGLVLFSALILIGGLLAILAPFFIYGTNSRTRETSKKLDTTNKLLGQMLGELEKLPKAERIEEVRSGDLAEPIKG